MNRGLTLWTLWTLWTQRTPWKHSARVAACALAALVVLATTALTALPTPAFAQDATGAGQPGGSTGTLPRTITVVGTGKVRVEPDIARVTIGVDVARPTVREASDANKEIVDQVIAAIKGAGVADKDVQTNGFSVYAERYGTSGPLPEDEITYRVTNNVAVVVRDLSTVSSVLEAAIDAGANNIYGIEFALSDPTAYETDAMAKAVDSANAKAAQLAKLTGVTLGEIVSVSEVVGVNPLYLGANQAVGMGGGGGPTVQPGMLELSLQLQVVYAIE